MRRPLPVLILWISLVSVVPAFADQTTGLPADSGQGNVAPFGGYVGSFQQVYTASAFSAPITITALQFFNTQSNSGATSLPFESLTIALTTTQADSNTLSN